MWYGVAYTRKKWYSKYHTSHTASAALETNERKQSQESRLSTIAQFDLNKYIIHYRGFQFR